MHIHTYIHPCMHAYIHTYIYPGFRPVYHGSAQSRFRNQLAAVGVGAEGAPPKDPPRGNIQAHEDDKGGVCQTTIRVLSINTLPYSQKYTCRSLGPQGLVEVVDPSDHNNATGGPAFMIACSQSKLCDREIDTTEVTESSCSPIVKHQTKNNSESLES